MSLSLRRRSPSENTRALTTSVFVRCVQHVSHRDGGSREFRLELGKQFDGWPQRPFASHALEVLGSLREVLQAQVTQFTLEGVGRSLDLFQIAFIDCVFQVCQLIRALIQENLNKFAQERFITFYPLQRLFHVPSRCGGSNWRLHWQLEGLIQPEDSRDRFGNSAAAYRLAEVIVHASCQATLLVAFHRMSCQGDNG